MIAVITGFLQSAGFLWESLVFPSIWLSQALAQVIHRSLWKQRDNLFVRRAFHAWLLRCWESTKTFRLLLLYFHERLCCKVCFSCSIQHKVHFFQIFEQLSFHVSRQVGHSRVGEKHLDMVRGFVLSQLDFLQSVWHTLPPHPLLISPNFSVAPFSVSSLWLPACCRQNCNHHSLFSWGCL